MNVWYLDTDTVAGPVWMLVQLEVTREQRLDVQLLAVVGQRANGGWQGLIPRQCRLADEDPALMLAIHPNKYEAMGEVLDHLGIEAESFLPEDV